MEYTISVRAVAGANTSGIMALRKKPRHVYRIKGVLWAYEFNPGVAGSSFAMAVSKSTRHLSLPPSRADMFELADSIFGLVDIRTEVATAVGFQTFRRDLFVPSDKLVVPPLVACLAGPGNNGDVRCTILYDEVGVSEIEYTSVLWDSISRPGNLGRQGL